MDNIYLEQLIKTAARKGGKQASGSPKNNTNRVVKPFVPTQGQASSGMRATPGTISPGVYGAPTPPAPPTAAGKAMQRAGQFSKNIQNSPWTKAIVEKAKKVSVDVGKKVEGKVTDKVVDTASGLIDKATGSIGEGVDKILGRVGLQEAAKETATTAAKSGMPTALKVGLGALGGLGLGVGAYKGYVGMNKEATMANLLEQGYSVEAAVLMVKQAEESEQFKDLIRAQRINDAADYRGAAEGMGLGLATGTLGAGAAYLASKGKINAGGRIATGAMLGYLPGVLVGTMHGRAAARENALNKEATMANLLEQGYSVEAALGMLL